MPPPPFQFYIVRLEHRHHFSALTLANVVSILYSAIRTFSRNGVTDAKHVSILYSAIRTKTRETRQDHLRLFQFYIVRLEHLTATATATATSVSILYSAIRTVWFRRPCAGYYVSILYSAIRTPHILQGKRAEDEAIAFAKLLLFSQKQCRCALIFFPQSIDIRLNAVISTALSECDRFFRAFWLFISKGLTFVFHRNVSRLLRSLPTTSFSICSCDGCLNTIMLSSLCSIMASAF